ncbi:DUF2637 domain-containing protein [Streptomyces nanshensis]|uniref:DUF2637 domain-containing protein n=1 Tax=Streptomyces nanshensis TaxID=518642 RepID=A0A1E7LAG7_9ACTN|nr:DUF2637 domain-containing protein [Streptomyces nanshensis]OEV13148.1 hypothetical protein AN218_04880 [Streptomyces nanshensis]
MTNPAPTHDPTTPLARRVSGWDRAAILALGAAACALSYDALQQMAIAIHIRGPLTYLFPLVIDGFIAYGVRALLVLNTAPFRARLYVWTLFGTATAASLWANALHAIRLNNLAESGGLRLGDITVGLLSALAPLALAGAVHLYILIARQTDTGTKPDHSAEASPLFDEADVSASVHNDEIPARRMRRIGRPPGAELPELLDLARPLFAAHETPTRETVRHTIRTAGHSISEDRLTQIMTTLRTGPTPRTGD